MTPYVTKSVTVAAIAAGLVAIALPNASLAATQEEIDAASDAAASAEIAALAADEAANNAWTAAENAGEAYGNCVPSVENSSCLQEAQNWDSAIQAAEAAEVASLWAAEYASEAYEYWYNLT
ncbi:MAG TPA: hypothetical protein VG839_02165 [Asticcacaulis sp.]|nr:hypothetical protein [Asticcacaulis sp.]